MPISFAVAGDLVLTAAQTLAENERARLPDLTAVSVVLPNLSCARRFSEALFSAAKTPVILLPNITTLAALGTDAPDLGPVVPNRQRVADVYHALRERGWLAREDLWSLAYEVVAIVDEMNTAGHGLPATPQALLAQIHAVYRTGHDKPIEFEAKLLFELWYALSKRRGALDPTAARHLALAQLAAQASAPLYVVGVPSMSRREQAFLHAYAERAPVYVFEADNSDYRKNPLPRALYVAAWAPYAGESPSAQEAQSRLEYLRSAAARPITNLTLLPAHSLEHEAANLARVVRHWLAEGHKSIGIIALDRLVARRLRALLERERVPVDDEAGWALSTTRAAGVVMGLARSDQPQAGDQLAFLRSALSFTGWLDQDRRLALARLEQAIVKARNPAARAEDFAAQCAPMLVRHIDRLAAALRRIGTKPRPLALWTAALLEALDITDLHAALTADSAGSAVLNLLEALRRESSDDSNALTKTEWLEWLDRELEHATFRAPLQGAAVTFTHLEASRLRRFECVAFAGADDQHLPGNAGSGAFFNESVRRELGLTHHLARLREIESALIQLCFESSEIVVSWQQTLEGETNLVSRYFSRLGNLHQRLFGHPLRAVELALESAEYPLDAGEPKAPRPSLTAALLPQSTSASAYNSLIACPYQFYAKHVLRLNENEEDDDLDKRDYGILVHRVLQEFHSHYPRLIGLGEQAAEAALAETSEIIFGAELARDFVANAWLLKWKKQIPAYVAWQLNRERDGWRWHEGEVAAQAQLHLSEGRLLTLAGRIDRVDVRSENGENRYAIFDYKGQRAKPLNDKLAIAGEDVQLPFYALLRPDAVEVAYLALDDETIAAAAPDQALPELAAAVEQRLQAIIEALAQGAPLPAHGDTTSCGYCTMRVVCRRDYW